MNSCPRQKPFFVSENKIPARKSLREFFDCQSLSAEHLQKKLRTERRVLEGKRRREDGQ